ncbi:MAG: OmpH family outer membrane protein, partial [Bacteroidota bacterium]|nr:OmpH family outer membrane protein [Bacteroidota bacterium]
MKNNVIFLSIALIFLGLTAEAQRSIRIGYVDMNYILENVPEYQEAQAQLDKRVADWKTEIEKRTKEIDQMKKVLENERVLLTQELIKEREDEIKFVENEVLQYQQKRFGPEGDLMKQRSILVEPIQDQVFNAVQEIAEARQYDFVLDKSS